MDISACLNVRGAMSSAAFIPVETIVHGSGVVEPGASPK
jgi:hypothetical protein